MFHGRSSSILLAGALCCALASRAAGATPPDVKCAAGKIGLSGKHAACAAKAEGDLVLKGDPDRYAGQLAQCGEKFDAKWAKLEAGGACWSTGDGPPAQDVVEATAWGVARAIKLGGESSTGPVQAAYVKSIECFELQRCCIVKIGYYDPNLQINVTNTYSNCNETHTWEQW